MTWHIHLRAWGIIILISIVSTVLLWWPFLWQIESFWGIPLPQQGMGVIVSNFDTPYYIVVSQTWYRPELIRSRFEFDLPTEYYPAHFPLYPAAGAGLKTFLPISLPYALLGTSLLFAALSAIAVYHLARQMYSDKLALIAALISLFLPARWYVVRSIASPEPMFIFFTLMALLSYLKQQYWRTGMWGSLAQLTKPPGGLLLLALAAHWLYQHREKLYQPCLWRASLLPTFIKLGLIPLSLLALFTFYARQTGDFWAYFHSGDNIHLFWPPFQMFNRTAFWVGTIWLEDIIWLLLITGIGITLLWRLSHKFRPLASYATVFWLSLIFVSHRDLSRYALPIMPLIWLAFAPYLIKKPFLWLMVLLLPIYLYALNFIAFNTVSISNWQPLL